MAQDPFFQPVSALSLPRFAGIPTFMRLPFVPPSHPRFSDVQLGLVGVPWDGGTSNRPGARHGPRQLRDCSTMVRPLNPVTGINPVASVNCADLGDVPPNPADIQDNLHRITTFYDGLHAAGIAPMTAGGDHLLTLGVLRGLARDGALGMIQFDSHTDLFDNYFDGQRFTHGTMFRRAVEEGLVDPKRFVQVGIRGTAVNTQDIEWGLAHGVRIIRIEEVFKRGIENVTAEVRQIVGTGAVYCTYDIDFLDPSCAPGTGTPEIGGVNSFQAQQVIRAMIGLDLVGADLVEVAPPFDQGGMTAWVGVSLMFELMGVLSQAITARRAQPAS